MRVSRRAVRRFWLAAAVTGLLVIHTPPAAAEPPPPAAIAGVRLARARETRAFTERELQHLSGGTDCPRAVFVSYARSTSEPGISDQWYQASQIWADLALAPREEPLARCWVLRGFTFLDRFWDREDQVGGFYAGADLEGERPNRTTKFVDDNSLAGLVWMEAALRAPQRLERELLLGRARETADFLMFGGLWDETFGGGFWWNTDRGATLEGKPAQSNGLAAQFFLELYGLTGEPAYRDWAGRTLAWLDATLYDPEVRLYRWGAHHADLERREGEVIAERYFNYDQGILIEAHLRAERLLGERRHYERARALGERLDPVFWDAQLGGYDLEAGIPQVFPVYSAWVSQSLLRLHERDHNPHWLGRAAATVDALDRAAWDPARGGYYHRYYVCRDPSPPGCADGAAQAVDTTEKHSVDQAWMQRALALLATALAREVPAPVSGDR